MGKRWDYDVPSTEIWREVLRVLKPGGHLLSFGGTRTYHRMVVNIEDAGFEIRDQIQWLYGSGFPKSLDISKAIDKAAGAEREVTGKKSTYRKPQSPNGWDCTKRAEFESAPSTDLAKQWQGWGTALKPANEPIVLARKPLIGTVAKNVEMFGVGGLNIDESRIGCGDKAKFPVGYGRTQQVAYGKYPQITEDPNKTGRWPANVLFDEAAVEGHEWSRFFYVAKASKRERNAGLEGMPEQKFEAVIGSTKNQLKRMQDGQVTGDRKNSPQANHHPTVKPIKLMQYLIKLVTPKGGTVLDPFMGSGSTGVAAVSLGFDFIGIEREQEYLEIAKRRIEHSA
jgi:site-specific DNA-methyltransferase (adenine-specific)